VGFYHELYVRRIVHTDPGLDSPFSPPAGFIGDYLAMIRRRYSDEEDAPVRKIRLIARMIRAGENIQFTGLHSAQAERIVRDITSELKDREGAYRPSRR